jgi:thiamine-monophosphate kinase
MPLPEKALIAQIRSMVESASQERTSETPRAPLAKVLAGIGDDCAVLGQLDGRDLLVTTDFSLEGIHFRRDWHPAEAVGHRCLARGLSDIAAMGGEPVTAFLSLALPRDLAQAWIQRFVRGLLRLAKKHGVMLAGGDTAESPDGILADIVVVGTVPKGKAVLRSGARPGDRVLVSGALGGSAATVMKMMASPRRKLRRQDYPRHFYPEPRVELGRILREKGLATAMIDLSDGLSTDLAHICEESGAGAEIESTVIPRARVGTPAREVDLDFALHGGEDYELLFTAPPGKRVPSQIAGVGMTQIGHITRGRGIFLQTPKGPAARLVPRGWEHFRR